jgi:HK97 family phage major capsid protein
MAPTAEQLLGEIQKLNKAVEGAGKARSNGTMQPSGLYQGWSHPEESHKWPAKGRVAQQISKNYNPELALDMLVNSGRAKALGWGPAFEMIWALTYPQHASAPYHGMKPDEIAKKLEAETGFISTRKAVNDGWKGPGGQIHKTALTEGSGLAGGYIVPPQFQNELLTIAGEDSFIEPRCKVLPMTTRTAEWPTLDIFTVQAAGTTPYYGGVLATWQPEGATIDESEPQFRMDTFTAWDLQLLAIASNQLLADNGIGLDALLTQLFGGALAFYRQYAWMRGLGSGSSMPLGVLNSGCTIQNIRSVGGAFRLADVASMWSHLQIRSWKDACWVMHQSVFPQLMQMNNGATNGFLTWLNPMGQGVQGPVAGSMPLTLMGLPIFWTEVVPTLGNPGDVTLCDFSRYVIAQRMDLQIDVSREYRFAQNQMTWRCLSRGDGKPWTQQAITDSQGWTISPFVMNY